MGPRTIRTSGGVAAGALRRRSSFDSSAAALGARRTRGSAQLSWPKLFLSMPPSPELASSHRPSGIGGGTEAPGGVASPAPHALVMGLRAAVVGRTGSVVE